MAWVAPRGPPSTVMPLLVGFDRLKRLSEGGHPYKAYNYFIQGVGPLRGNWMSLECVQQADSRVFSGVSTGSSQCVLGQETAPDVLSLLRSNEEEFEALVGALQAVSGHSDALEPFEEDDPFPLDGAEV